jgi:hypothetical protein
MLNLPIPVVMKLKESEGILILGMGGGFDVFSGLPIHYTLEKMGIKAHIANFTHAPWPSIPNHVETIPMASGCVGITGNIKQASENLPEAYLSSWFRDVEQKDVTVWAFKRDQNVKEYSNSLNTLVKHLGIDTILLVDGGVDSIMIGDEDGSGTMLEDTLTLAAVKNANVKNRILACVGFGTEIEENLSHYLALENMAKLNKQQAFYGTCSLVSYMESFKQYKAICEHTWNQPGHRKSHVQTRVIPAAEGEFGDYHMFPDEKTANVFISPLMSVYWFYNADAAIYNNAIIPLIEEQESFYETVQVAVPVIKKNIQRQRRDLPLT